ncbi:hypothetical protein [Sphingomonas sp. SUN039]|uniref:hypothetical protein n=1 Tax=Sphingomonas sp. SUN039 TaxID=2937787 RepID=UPI0021646203|nr:hypothetical protein [Sphingomonas sp. SUN039]UVO55706.1 hypothetical protein M0209_16890 [Sphingomonas sp. SUN039]
MPQTLTWSFSAGSPSGALNTSGSTEVDALVSASVTLDAAMANTKDLALQIDDVAKVRFLSISSSDSGGKVEVKGSGAAIALTGPLVLYGAAVPLFATDLSTIKVQNKHATNPATLTILAGLTLGA